MVAPTRLRQKDRTAGVAVRKGKKCVTSLYPRYVNIYYSHRAHGVVVSHPLRMRKALGSNPSVSIM